MDQEFTKALGSPNPQSPASAQSPLVEVMETSAPKGEWLAPAVDKVCVALALSDFSAKWRGKKGLRSEDIRAGTMAICELNYSQLFEMRTDAEFGVVMVLNEVLEQASEKLSTCGLRSKHAKCSTI